MKDKAYSWFDVITKFVDVCYSCSSQNIDTSNNEQYICKDCKSEDSDPNVTMNSQSPFIISSNVNQQKGYLVQKCVLCSSESTNKTF